MDSMPKPEITIHAASIPLSRRIFSIFTLLAVISIAMFGLLAFISEREHQRETIRYRNEQWLTIGTRYIHSVMDNDYLDLLRLAGSDLLFKGAAKDLSARLGDETKAWPGVYLEIIDAQGKILASSEASASVTDKSRNGDNAVRLSALNKARQNQQFVDMVGINNTIFMLAASPITALDGNKSTGGGTGNYLLMYREIDRTFMRNIQMVIDHHVGLLPAATSDPAYVIESIPGAVNSVRSIAPLENDTNVFPIQRIENINGKKKLVSYTPVRNQAGQILAYLFVVDSGSPTPGTDLSIFLIIMGFGFFCLLFAAAFYASYNIRLVVGRLRAVLAAAESTSFEAFGNLTQELRRLSSSRQLGDIADHVQKLLDMVYNSKIDLEYALRDKNSTLIDFQEYKEAVESLSAEKLAAENAYHELFDDSPEGLFDIDEDGHFITVNKSLAEMLGYSDPEQCMAEVSSFSEQVCASSDDWTGLKRELTRSTRFTREIDLIRRDRTSLHASLCLKRKELMRDADTFVYYGMVTDLSAQMRLREAENQSRAAAAASSYKSQFLARMSHEIRTPLNAIIGMSELMYETKLSEEQKEYVDILKNAGQSLLGIINDVLDFSKVESGKMTLERIAVDISDLVEKIGHEFEITARNKGLEFEAQIAPNLPPRVGCDPLRLRQILGNLLANAIKFTEKGKVTLAVRPHPEAPREIGATTLMFSVTDTGIGVPEQQQDKIFEDFIQADNSVTRRFGGTGLGLSICKILTEMMGGTIMLSSEENKGTTVYVTIRFEHLPFLAEDADKTRTRPETSLPRSASMQVAESHFGIQPVNTSQAPPGLPTTMDDGYAATQPDLPATMEAASGRARLSEGAAEATRAHGETSEQEQADLPELDSLPPDAADTGNENNMLVYPDKDNPQQLNTLGIMTSETAIFAGGDVDANTPRPLKILHVEDNPNNRQIFSLYLRNTPHLLVEAHNGEEAVEAFRKHHFDLIFMDIEMPLMDGNQATRILRAMEEEKGLPPTPILAITAHVLPEARQSMFAAGCNEFIAKPYRKSDILDMIDKYGYGGVKSGKIS